MGMKKILFKNKHLQQSLEPLVDFFFDMESLIF